MPDANPDPGGRPGQGLGGGGTDWRHLITTTLLAGGDGYCLHSTMTARPDTRELLAAVRRIGATFGSAIPPGVDFTHFDFHFLNLLSDGTTITGVVDINPPPVAGDRAFDLAHMVLRQVEWSVRHYPSAPATWQLLHLGQRILGDIGEPGPSR